MSSVQLSDDTNVRVDDQGFIYFEIDDGEDDAPFECGEIGLGYVIDAMEEVLAAKNEEDKTFTVENYPLVEVTLIDNDFYLIFKSIPLVRTSGNWIEEFENSLLN